MSSKKETNLIYYEEPYLLGFIAKVVAIEEDKKGKAVILDRTSFYPEGGGQPADLGTIGEASVLDVKKRDGVVLHYVEELPETIREGSDVECLVDPERRLAYMQQHTGQHLLSAVLYRDLGHQTLSIHQGNDTTSIEIDAEDVGDEEIHYLEDKTLELVGQNRAVRSFWVDEDELSSLDLRREPKVSGRIRIVEIEGYDAVACGGVHTAGTGEVCFVHHVATEKIRGRTRLHWKIGRRAVEDYRQKTQIISTLVDLFSTPQDGLLERIEGSNGELLELRRENGLLEERVAAMEAQRLLSSPSVSPHNEEGTRVVTASFHGESKEFLRKLADRLLEEPLVAFCGTNETDKGLQWLVVLGEEIDKKIDFNKVKGELLQAIDGKGGGKPPVWQGVGENPSGVEEFFRLFRELFTRERP